MNIIFNLPFTIDLFVVLLMIPITVRLYNIRKESELRCFTQENTLPLRGILAIIIVLHHLQQNYQFHYLPAFNRIGGPVVAEFFFLSGYGLLKSFIHKKEFYLHGFLRKRLGKILPLFILLNVISVCLCVCTHYISWNQIIDNLRGGQQTPLWYSWFIYVIIYLYIGFYLVARVVKNPHALIIGVFCIILTYVLLMINIHFPIWWYNSIWSFLTGMLVSLHESRLRRFIASHARLWILFLGISWGMIRVLIKLWPDWGSFAQIHWAPFLILTVVYTLGGTTQPYIRYLGKKSMDIYLYQGLFIMILTWIMPR